MLLLVPLLLFVCLISVCGSMQSAKSRYAMALGGTGLSGATNDPREMREGMQPPPALDPSIPLDLDTAGLVCVRLPGVSYPRTSALDRRIAPLQIGVLEEADRQGLAPLRYTWALRTECQQRNVQPVGTALKARVGSSSHESGSAVDMSGLRARSDRQRIIAIYRQFGAQHGTADWPHFAWPGSLVGEPNKHEWIKRQRREFRNGRVEGGCIGPECGGV
jgi:hypothetical protein